MQAGYRVRSAEERDLPALAGIELRAARLYADRGLPPALLEETTPRHELEAACASGLLWVAVDAEDDPVGFAQLVPLGAGLHLEELDVDPAHGRRGVGTALVERVCDAARRRGYDHLTLTTYADVPWNAPFYERHGFRVLARGEHAPELRRLIEEEARQGRDPARRVAMRRSVARSRGALRWLTAAWLLGVIGLSALASTRPLVVIQWSSWFPGRDKTGHLVLMGGLAAVAVLGFAGARLGHRRVSAPLVLAATSVLVLVDEGVQYWSRFRNFSLVDLAYSLAGVAIFGGLAWAWRAFRAREVGQPPIRAREVRQPPQRRTS